MKKNELRASINQLPVGQGGFLIGTITNEYSEVFTYAFDCGSVNREHFEQGLTFCSPGKIDILFISHLDADHINGIDALAAHTQIDTVILPCLDALHMTMIACEAVGDAGVRMSVQSFLADSSAWLADRGVKRIFHVQRGDSEAETQPFVPDQDQSNGNEIVQDAGDDNERRPYTIISERVGEAKTIRSGTVIINTIGEHSSILVGNAKRKTAWFLLPYVHPFPSEDVALFRKAVGGVFSSNFASRDMASKVFARKLLELLRDESTRDTLKSCYALLSKDNNKPSLSLYSGPNPALSGTRHISRTDERHWPFLHSPHFRVPPLGASYPNKGAAWLCTGDANLKKLRTRTPWLTRFHYLLDEVEVFTLPHHGSNTSIHNDVITRMKGSVMIACAATGRDKHPHLSLLGRLQTFEQCVWQVSEDSESAYTLNVTLNF